MLRILYTFVMALVLGWSISAAESTGLAPLKGKWEVKKKNDEGQNYTQVLEITNGKFVFKILNEDQESVLHAIGDVAAEKLGPFNVLKFTRIQAGRSADELESVDDDRTVVYQLGYRSLTLASNLDKERSESPALDVYKKISTSN